MINAARTRYYTIRHNRQPFIRLGGDNGLAERSETLDQIKLVPSERTDFVFTPQDEPGTVDWLKWYPTERGYGSTFNRFSEEMMEIVTVNEPEVLPESIPTELRHIEQIDVTGAKELLIDLTIVFPDDNTVEMGINGIPTGIRNPLKPELAKLMSGLCAMTPTLTTPFTCMDTFSRCLMKSASRNGKTPLIYRCIQS